MAIYIVLVLGMSLMVLGMEYRGPVTTIEELAAAAREAVATAFLIQLVLLGCALPGMLGGAVSGERTQQTLGQLLITTLRDQEILGGKLFAALAQVAYLIFATLPLLGICFVVGGVSLELIAKGTAVCLSTVAFVACASVLASTLARRPLTGIMLAYVLLGLLYVGEPIAEIAILTGVLRRYSDLWCLVWHPVSALAVLTEPGSSGPSGLPVQESLWWLVCCAWSLPAAAACYVAALARLSRLRRRSSEGLD